MNAPDLFELGGLDILDEIAVETTRATDEHIDRTKRADHLIDCVRALRRIAEVRRHKVGVRGDRVGRHLEQGGVARDKPNLRPERTKLLRGCEADSP